MFYLVFCSSFLMWMSSRRWKMERQWARGMEVGRTHNFHHFMYCLVSKKVRTMTLSRNCDDWHLIMLWHVLLLGHNIFDPNCTTKTQYGWWFYHNINSGIMICLFVEGCFITSCCHFHLLSSFGLDRFSL